MLGNQVELWEAMLPWPSWARSSCRPPVRLASADLVDRLTRGGAKFVIANAGDTAKFDDVPGDYTRIVVGDSVDGWHSYSAPGRRGRSRHAPTPTIRC